MIRGFPSHIDLTVSDIHRSTEFYDIVLSKLGYARIDSDKSGTPCWVTSTGGSHSFSIALQPAQSDRTHDRYSPGLHHLAFHTTSRKEVDEFYTYLLKHNIVILDKPAEYSYTLGYYAVFFADPDGLKLEIVYEPNIEAG